VLAEPPKSGFDLLAWLVPLGLLGAGAVGVAAIVWGWSHRRPEAGPSTAVEPELERRLDDELDRFDQ
jgi:cytochrome c-type biogenesis protein CcmH